MKQIIRFCLLLVGALGWMSCGQGNDPIADDGKVVRTVLVYVVADNNLASFADADYEEMMEGMKQVSENNRLLVYMDRTENAKWGTPVLIELRNWNGTVMETVVKRYESNRNSVGVDETLEVFNDVFNASAYKADSYGLVYWSHGEGWIPYPIPSSSASTRWIGQDKGEGDNRMNLSDFVSVLQSVPHFDFIMFDACFMQSIEVAYEVRNYTDYCIGSPTETPGPGAPYDKIIPYMFVQGGATDIADAYFRFYQETYNDGINISDSNWTGGTSIAVLQTSRLDELAEVTRNYLPEKVVDNGNLSQTVFNYDKRSFSSMVGYYDMYQLMGQVMDADDFVAWKQAFDAAVVYWNTTPKNYSSQFKGMFSMEGTHGITHYIPRSIPSAVAEAYRSTAWYQAAGLKKLGW